MPPVATHRETAYRVIRGQIAGGTLPPGSRVSELDLAATIGISRTPIREAINRLESEGLIEQVPRFGAFVRRLNRKEVEDLYDLRMLLEGYAAERAAERLSEADLDCLDQIVARQHAMTRATRDARQSRMTPEQNHEWVSLDVAFHMVIVQASDNALVGKAVADYRIMSSLCGVDRDRPDYSLLKMQAWTWNGHRRIARFLRRRDAAAAGYWMRNHITRAKTGVLLQFDRSTAVRPPASEPWHDSLRELLGDMEVAI